MNTNAQEHIYKEMLKQTVDNCPNFSETTKQDIKAIVDAGKSPEEICKAMLTYFAAIRWF